MIKNTDRIFNALAGLLFAVGVLYLAVPRTIAAFKAFDSAATVAALAVGESPEMEGLRELILNRSDLLRWAKDPRYAKDMSRAYHGLVFKAGLESRFSTVAATRAASIAELSLRPLDGAAWWRLAVMEDLRVLKPTRLTAEYLQRSVRVQPNAQALTPVRLRLIVENWSQFEPDEQRELAAHMAASWKRHRAEFVKMAAGSRNKGILREALASREDILIKFEADMAAAEKREAKKKL